MREASIILPHTMSHEPHTAMRHLLLTHFGGYTTHEVSGAWRDPDTGIVHNDQSTCFIVASNTGPNMLYHIAEECGKMAGQICVYVKGFDGEVTFVQC